MFITKVRQRKGRRVYQYWLLKETIWNSEERRSYQQHIASIGPKRTITQSQAQDIAHVASEKLGQEGTVEELHKVKRLRIVVD